METGQQAFIVLYGRMKANIPLLAGAKKTLAIWYSFCFMHHTCPVLYTSIITRPGPASTTGYPNAWMRNTPNGMRFS